MKKLKEYHAKRDFTKTDEPSGDLIAQSAATSEPAKAVDHQTLFVVQEHDASHHHYDFRLEHDGVLLSWAVPKGPSLDPKDKRLAVHVEDHPLEYASFEGSIPEGQYGAGNVIVWDMGPYENVSDKGGVPLTMAAAMVKGHVRVRLHGRKLKGIFSLVHTHLGGEERNWLLMKEKDGLEQAGVDAAALDVNSVLTGKPLPRR